MAALEPTPAPRRRPARVRMSDVAAATGVSTKTVSNVLAGRPGASPATAAAVRKAAARLGYQRNTDAAALRSGRRGAVTLAVPTLQQPTYALLASCLVEALTDVQVLLELTGGQGEHERRLAAGSWRSQSDALVLLPRGTDPATLEREGTAPGLVLVADAGPSWAPRVTCPPATQALLVAGHLERLGLSSAAVLGADAPGERWVAQAAAALRGHGVEVPAQAVITVSRPGSLSGGVEACTRLLNRGPRVEAIVCSDDAVAAGVLAALHRRGVKVPGEVAVIGRGDTETAAYTSPALTSVSCAPQATAAALAQIVHELLTDPLTRRPVPARPFTEPARLVEVAPTLTVRESSAPLGAPAPGAPSGG